MLAVIITNYSSLFIFFFLEPYTEKPTPLSSFPFKVILIVVVCIVLLTNFIARISVKFCFPPQK